MPTKQTILAAQDSFLVTGSYTREKSVFSQPEPVSPVLPDKDNLPDEDTLELLPEKAPDRVELSGLSEKGELAYRAYLMLWDIEGTWHRSGEFKVRDFTALVLAIELFPLHNTDDYYPAFTEALSRSYIEWRRYSPDIATDPETPEGLLNWVFAQTGTSRSTPEDFRRTFLDNEFLWQQAYRSLELIVRPDPAWLAGCQQIHRPCFVGSNTPNIQLNYIDQFYLNGCEAFIFYGTCGEPDESIFSFILTRAQSLEYGR